MEGGRRCGIETVYGNGLPSGGVGRARWSLTPNPQPSYPDAALPLLHPPTQKEHHGTASAGESLFCHVRCTEGLEEPMWHGAAPSLPAAARGVLQGIPQLKTKGGLRRVTVYHQSAQGYFCTSQQL